MESSGVRSFLEVLTLEVHVACHAGSEDEMNLSSPSNPVEK